MERIVLRLYRLRLLSPSGRCVTRQSNGVVGDLAPRNEANLNAVKRHSDLGFAVMILVETFTAELPVI
jgi:hypothetical protein